jgi:MFS family permease
MSFFQRALLYVVALSIGTLSVGFTLGFYAAAYEACVDYFSLATWLEKSLFNSLCPIAAIIGSFLSHLVMSSHGRKGPCLCASVVVIVGWVLLLSTGRSYRILGFIARFIMGIGAGAVSTVTPVYIAELSPTDYRGSYGVMSQLATSTAAMLIYLMGIWLEWRTIAGLSIIAPGILLVVIYWIPESPTVSRCPSSESLVQKRFVKPFGVSVLLVIFQQFSGINALLTNLNSIFIKSKVNLKPSICSTVVSAAQVARRRFRRRWSRNSAAK